MDRLNSTTILHAKAITKSFTGVGVLSGVDFELRKGEIHAIVGENGAEKMKGIITY